MNVGDEVSAEVRADLRSATARNHSATHLLHAALRQVLGTHVQQKGSLVCADYLRFDFSHPEAIKAEQLDAIEAMVNAEVLGNNAVQTELTDIEAARAKGAMALFGEKYGDTVRVLSMGTPGFLSSCVVAHMYRARAISA
jgi:alanyl-tRNA synthetase